MSPLGPVAYYGEGRGVSGPPRVIPERKKIVGKFTKNSGQTRSDRWKRCVVTSSRGWHPSEINKSESDEQKKVVDFSGENK